MNYINFSTFSKLYSEAVESDSLDFFVSERGWQEEWMDGIGITKIVKILEEIYFLANSSLADIRKKYDYSRARLSRKYYIPTRTLQDWESGVRTAPPYVLAMLYYMLFLDVINEVKKNEIEK